MAKARRSPRTKSTTSGGNAAFPVEQIRELVELMESHDLSEINLRSGDQHWRLRRGPHVVAGAAPIAAAPAVAPSPAAAPAPAAPSAPAGGDGGSDAAAAEDVVYIKSPTVGTFYSAPSPEDPPFVTVGSHVTPDTTVCIVEAMKVFNQIPAEVHGTILEALVEDGQPVEFGQPLFRVRPD